VSTPYRLNRKIFTKLEQDQLRREFGGGLCYTPAPPNIAPPSYGAKSDAFVLSWSYHVEKYCDLLRRNRK